jgi:hypothetical protein
MKAEYAVADLDASDNFFVPIEAGVAVINVAHRVVTAFAGGTPTINIGDSAATDSWLTQTNLAEGTENNFVGSLGTTASNSGGKYYAAVNYIKVTGSTELTVGAGEIYIMFIDAKTNWRTENDLS